ncbi:MAG: hypothetical protein IJP17_03990, partial [Clostridia bacterium]|nr:hypothetical protein [Clostridia bacterium]
SPSFAFSYRTAAALCSIVLVLALGFIVARIALPSPAVDTTQTHGRAAEASEPLISGADASPDGNASADSLIVAAQAEGGSYIVLRGEAVAFSFLPQEDADDDIRAIVQISPSQVLACALPQNISDPTADEYFGAQIAFADEGAMQDFLDAMGAQMVLHLTAHDDAGGIVWRIERYMLS